MLQEAFRVNEFCKIYAISKAGFYREVTARKLHIIKRGKTTLVTRSEAERWFEAICAQTRQPTG